MGRRPGPKPRGEFEDKSKVFTTRIRADTREWLEQSAKANKLSLSQQVERLLRRAWDEDRYIEKAFGSRRNFALMRLIAATAETIGSRRRGTTRVQHSLSHRLFWRGDAGQAAGRETGLRRPARSNAAPGPVEGGS